MAKKLRDEDLNLNIIVNGDKAKKELGDLEQSSRELLNRNKELRQEREKLQRAGKQESERFREITAEIKQNNKSLKDNEQRMKELRNEIGLTGLTMRQLQAEQNRLRRLMNSVTPNTPQWRQWRDELIKIEGQIGKIRAGSKSMHLSIGKMAEGFNKYFGMISVWVASLTGIIFGFKKASNSYAEITDNLGDVQNTTKLSREEVEMLNAELEKVDTRTAQENLLNLAWVAGKLGKEAYEDVFGFVKASDQIVVAMERDLGGAEAAVREIGKLTDIFDLTKLYGQEQALLKVASAVKTLGNASTASEGYIVNFVQRAAGLAPLADVTAQNVMGIGATLDMYGQKVELSATAYSKILTSMAKKTADYAQVAGMSVAEFQKLFDDDANEAMIRVFEGMGKNSANFREIIELLGDLGVEGQRLTSVYGVLAKHTDTLRAQQELANAAFEAGTAITDEFNIKNTTRQAQLEKARKNYAAISRELGKSLSPAVLVSTNAFTYFMKALVAVIRITRQYYPVLIGSGAAIVAYTIALRLNTAAQRANFLQTKLGVAIDKTYAFVKGVLTGQIKIATLAQRAWNAAVKANPVGLAIAGIIAAGTAIWQYAKYLNSATAAQKALGEVEKQAKQNVTDEKVRAELLLEVAKDQNRSLKDREKALKELNEISPEYFGNLNKEKINARDAKDALDQYTESLLKNARVVAAREKLVELEKERIDAIEEGTDYQIKWYQALWNHTKSFGNVAQYAYYQAETGAKNAAKAEEDYLEKRKALLQLIKEGTDISSLFDDDEDEDDGSGGKGGKGTGDEKLKALETAFKKEQALIKQQFLQGSITQTDYDQELLIAEMAFLDEKLKLYDSGSLEYLEVVNQRLELQLNLEKKYKDLLLKADQELEAARIENIKDGLAKQEATENQRWENEKAALEARLIDKENLSADEIALNEKIYRIIEEREAAHRERLRLLREGADMQRLRNLVTAASPVDANFATLDEQQEFFDARTALIEAQYAREKELAEGNAAALLAAEKQYKQDSYAVKKDQIEAEFRLTDQRIDAAQSYVRMLAAVVEEESALGKALFLFNQALAVGEVWVNIAKANAKAIALSPLTGGQPWVSMNTTQGAIQTGIILGQTIAKFSRSGKKSEALKGKKTGGFADRGSDDDVAGFYHANEWIASAPLVRNPVVRRVIDVFEEAQRKGTSRTLDMNAILAAVSAPGAGRRSGGYAGYQPGETPQSAQYERRTRTATPQSFPASDETLEKLTKALNDFMKFRPVVAVETIERRLKQLEEIERTTGL